MTVYLVQQNLYREGEFGDLELSDLLTIGIFDSLEKVEEIQKDFIPTKFVAQFGSGLQDLIITPIELNTKVNKFSTWDGNYFSEEDLKNEAELNALENQTYEG